MKEKNAHLYHQHGSENEQEINHLVIKKYTYHQKYNVTTTASIFPCSTKEDTTKNAK